MNDDADLFAAFGRVLVGCDVLIITQYTFAERTHPTPVLAFADLTPGMTPGAWVPVAVTPPYALD
jgi:hypothetical protein